jgi:hypothetical protein
MVYNEWRKQWIKLPGEKPLSHQCPRLQMLSGARQKQPEGESYGITAIEL